MATGRRYAAPGNATAQASATLPMETIVSNANVRPKLYDLQIGSDATPADVGVKFQIQRFTAAGTAGSSPTPQALDPADPAAQAALGLAVFSVGPTLTASAFLLNAAFNGRANWRWIAAPDSEIIAPATAANGLALMNPVQTGSAQNWVWTLYWAE